MFLPVLYILENEIHVVLNCCIYDDLRESLVRKTLECVPHFYSLSDENKFVFDFAVLH